MDAAQLQSIAIDSMCEAYAERADESSENEQVARAWERLSDAADSLHAILTRQELYDAALEPGASATG